MSMSEATEGEPALTYWRPKPPAVYPSGQCLHQGGVLLPNPAPHRITYPATPGFCYPITDIVHSYVQNQEIGLLELAGNKGEQRRLSQYTCRPVSQESLLTAMSSASHMHQNSQLVTDSLIHDEVSRAAKTLFSKRNRTLLHWLNPGISKNQLKIDVNAAWDILPQAEKVFYISQVLGKFAPHSTSLMVNPHLKVNESSQARVKTVKRNSDNHTNSSNDSGCTTELIKEKCQPPTEPKLNKNPTKSKLAKKPPQKRKVEYSSDDEASCDSGLVVDLETTETPKVKRKYSKRQYKSQTSKLATSEAKNEIISCPMPVDVRDIKVEPNTAPNVPRLKRKYIKRKLVRKKYTKKETKIKPFEHIDLESTIGIEQPLHESLEQDPLACEEMDLWIEIEKNNLLPEGFGLLNEEVDSFWEAIGDPSSIFMDLEIE